MSRLNVEPRYRPIWCSKCLKGCAFDSYYIVKCCVQILGDTRQLDANGHLDGIQFSADSIVANMHVLMLATNK